MGKWLATATVGVLALLALLWLQLQSPAAEATATPVTRATPAPAAAAAQRHELAIKAMRDVAAAKATATKLDPGSDAFFYRFDEQVPQALTAEAAKCYTGGLERVHRNQKVKLGYKLQIKDGVVSVHDVKVIESTVNNKALEECFAREVAKVTWTDEELPDWLQDDELVIRPERGMKKFTAENRNYEGDGPIGKIETPVGRVVGSRELPVDSE